MNKQAIETQLQPNPFLSGLIIDARARPDFSAFEEPDDFGFRSPRAILMDANPYAKVFMDSGLNHIVNQLSDCAKSLFLYILFNLKPSKDYVIISSSEYAEATGTKSRTTIAKAKTELARLCFIAPTTLRTVYYINPAYFFWGSRIRKFPKNIVKHDE